MTKKITRIKSEAVLPTSPWDFCRRKKKVAAYAGVSTDHEEQQSSLAAQTDYYKKKILANPSRLIQCPAHRSVEKCLK